MNTDPQRLWWAGALLLAYGALCVAVLLRARRARARTALACDWLVACASQTGGAEQLAAHTVALLRSAGLTALRTSLGALDVDQLQAAERVLFVVSTHGEGDAPDEAEPFVRSVMQADPDLGRTHYAVLALGDSSYTHFCGFGRRLDAWLAGQGAQRLFERVEVDRAGKAAIETWQQHLCHLSGVSDAGSWNAPAFEAWQLAGRTLLNPGSAGQPVYRIVLAPPASSVPQWESGDLVQLSAPQEPDLPREFSIASVAADGVIELLVRLQLRADGSPGVASGWLCQGVQPEQALALRLRAHARFRLEANSERPLILIGNGTGIAGLRAHLKARIARLQHANWLVFGERNASSDFHYGDEILAWRDAGQLARLDLAFSRDQAERRYVQHCLSESAEALREWVARGAAIYVCGSLLTMAVGVHEALAAALGEDQLAQLAASGRYRRDVY